MKLSYILLIIISLIAVVYIVKYYILTYSLKNIVKQLKDVKEDSDNDRLLLITSFQKDIEELSILINNFIKSNSSIKINAEDKVNILKSQIENISHDLRTPLTSMLGYIKLLDKESMSSEDKESLDIIERKARSLQRLICNFYDLSRLEMDDYNINIEQIDIVRFIKENMLGAYQQLEESELEVDLNIDEKIIYINGDNDSLERIFHNMVVNATRYAKSYFNVELITQGDYVIISFENDTLDLNEEEVKHIFERFYMNDKSRSKQGTGLGLTISKLLVEKMGGEVNAYLVKDSLKIQYKFRIV